MMLWPESERAATSVPEELRISEGRLESGLKMRSFATTYTGEEARSETKSPARARARYRRSSGVGP